MLSLNTFDSLDTAKSVPIAREIYWPLNHEPINELYVTVRLYPPIPNINLLPSISLLPND